MKIIKIESCFNCPLSEPILKDDRIVSVCESGSNVLHLKEEIEANEPIPKWCPLDDK